LNKQKGKQMSEEEKKKLNQEHSDEGLGPISRRDFAIGSMAILGAYPGADAAVKTIAQTPAQTANQAGKASRVIHKTSVSPAAQTIRLTVNKWKYEIQVEPEWVLRDVLRNQLGFLSIKDMCNGYGACGSCTVIMDGRPILSCMTLAIECDGMAIETAEEVANAKPELIEAYVMNHCMQCGYCTPGFVVTAKALLDRIPKPTEKDIRDALGGNICRCGTYPQHILAIKEATTGRMA
jgi:aerobic-type carbon monoxide dehydrogenase small subunit (CoxS/CutS family)